MLIVECRITWNDLYRFHNFLFHTIGTNLGCNPGLADERAYRLPLVGDVGAPLPSCPSSNCGSCSRPPPLMGWIGRVRFGGVLQMHPTASSGAPREPQLVVLLGLRASRSWSRSCSLLPLSAWSSASSSASVADLCLRPPCVFSLRLPFLWRRRGKPTLLCFCFMKILLPYA